MRIQQPGNFSILVQARGISLRRDLVLESTGATVNLQLPDLPVSVLVHVVDADGQPVTGPPMVPEASPQKSFLSYECTTKPRDLGDPTHLWTATQYIYGIADTAIKVLSDAHCTGRIKLPDFSREILHTFDTTDQDLEYTFSGAPEADTRPVVSGVVTDSSGDPVRYA